MLLYLYYSSGTAYDFYLLIVYYIGTYRMQSTYSVPQDNTNSSTSQTKHFITVSTQHNNACKNLPMYIYSCL